MKKIALETPMLFGDHHVIALRNLILEVEGVSNVYASSSFRVIEIEYDEAKITAEQLEKVVDDSGYAHELVLPVEVGVSNEEDENPSPYFRKTAEYVTAKATLGFSQEIKFSGPPAWPSPGMGTIKVTQENE